LEDRVGLPVAAQHIRCGGDGECDGEVKLRQRCVSSHHASVALFASRGSPPANRAARGGGFVRQREREAANASRPPMSPRFFRAWICWPCRVASASAFQNG